MNCREMEERIALQVSGDLDPRDERLVEDHLAVCESCVQLAADLRADLEQMRTLRAEPADECALAAVRFSVVEQLESRRARTLSPVAWILALSNVRWAAAAAVILLVVISGLRHAGDADTPAGKIESAGKLAPDQEKPAPKTAAKEVRPRSAERATVQEASLRPAPSAKSNRDPIRRETPPSAQEDQPTAAHIEIVDARANSGVLSPPATLVKLKSSDPDVVLYWLVESNGG